MPKKNWPERHKAIRVALYNHKGGVGKTTLTANIAFALGKLGKRVLLVDADPQANLTSYFFDSDVVDDLLDHSDKPDGETIWSAVRPLVGAEGGFSPISPKETSNERVWLVPGDIRLAEFEEFLQDAWSECFQRRVRGYKAVTSIAQYVDLVSRKLKIDYVFYDVGPNIGPLNRVLLLDCDFFIVPVACDLFSRRALKTLGHTLSNWVADWKTIVQLAPDGMALLPGLPRYLGYIPQMFRTYGNSVAHPAAKQIPLLEKSISADILNVLRRVDTELVPTKTSSLLKLGEVQNFYSLVMLAQNSGSSVWDTKGDGAQKIRALNAFEKIAKGIVARARI